MTAKRDNNLTIVLAHEFHECRENFQLFAALSGMLISGQDDKALRLAVYSFYLSFIASLYEFYLGCIKSDGRFPRNAKGKVVDAVINAEVRKLRDLKCERIIQGRAPKWENDISYYRTEVPSEFGERFRGIRNMKAHADSRRSTVSLSEFYERYHCFVMLLFEEARWLWEIDNIEVVDWGAIENFAETFKLKNS